MKMEKITVGGVHVDVCQSCLDGEHLSHGEDHRSVWDPYVQATGRCDCKNVSDDGRSQCGCNPDWPELTAAIEDHHIDLVMEADERGWSWLPHEHSQLSIETGNFPKSLCICCREFKEPEVRLCADPKAAYGDQKYSIQSMCPECFGHLWTHLKGVPKETVTRYHERKDTT